MSSAMKIACTLLLVEYIINLVPRSLKRKQTRGLINDNLHATENLDQVVCDYRTVC